MSFTADDKLKCLRREIALWKTISPKWVDSGRMKQEEADREIAVLQEIHDDYSWFWDNAGRNIAATRRK